MANVPQTYAEYTGDGSTTAFTFEFDYLADSDIFVQVDGAAVAFTVTAPGQVDLASAPAQDARVFIYRETAAEQPQHKFNGGVPFILRYADENWEQLLLAVQDSHNAADYERIRRLLEVARLDDRITDEASSLATALADVNQGLVDEADTRESVDAFLQQQISDVFDDANLTALSFPLDLGSVSDPVDPAVQFDLGDLS